jgi:serine protease Do
MLLSLRLHASIAQISFAFLTSATPAEKVCITSTPPGAKVEINGVAVVTTPFEKDYPGGYFHKIKTAVGSRRGHSLVADLSFDGYAIKEIVLTEGRAEWISLKGRNYANYFLF